MFRIPPPYLWTPLSPQRVKGCSPLTIPKMRSKPKNASRFAKRIFLCFSHLRLRRRFHLSAGLYALRGPNTSCEAANRRNEKKALSAATSFFPFRQLLRGLKGASSPFLVGPARRNRWCFSGSLLARKRELSPNAKALYLSATSAQCRFPFSHAPFCISYYAFDRFAASAILSCATSDGDTPGMRPACPKFFGRMRASFSRASSVRPVSSV